MILIPRKVAIRLGLRCCGKCCERFPVNASLDELKTRAEKGDKEAQTVFDMIIPINGEFSKSGQQLYRCRHFLPSRNCGNYAGRPNMCRGYPYGKKCEHDDCTWRFAKWQTLPRVLIQNIRFRLRTLLWRIRSRNCRPLFPLSTILFARIDRLRSEYRLFESEIEKLRSKP